MTPISKVEPFRRAAGFTLLELLLVLTILGAASVFVVPNFISLDSRSFNAQVREATSLLNYSRRTAVVTGQPVRAIFRVGENDGTEDPELASGNSATRRGYEGGTWSSGAIEVRYRDSTNQRVEIEDAIEITFYPEGGSSGGEFTLSSDQRQATLYIDPFSGRVSTRHDDA